MITERKSVLSVDGNGVKRQNAHARKNRKVEAKKMISSQEDIDVLGPEPRNIRIFITGDTHGLKGVIERVKALSEGVTKKDYLMITGDFGVIWKEETLENDLEELEKIPITILFLDGNHENFDLLNKFPVETWNGGKTHRITENCLHLMRGQIFSLFNGEKMIKFATLGGAESKDKERRLHKQAITGEKIWWEEECISESDLNELKKNIDLYGNKIDYFISHCPSALVQAVRYNEDIERYSYAFADKIPSNSEYIVKRAIELFPEKISCICGHEHLNFNKEILNRNYIIVYDSFVLI